MNAILDNGNIRLTIDETGKLTELVLHENGINPLLRSLAGSHGI